MPPKHVEPAEHKKSLFFNSHRGRGSHRLVCVAALMLALIVSFLPGVFAAGELEDLSVVRVVSTNIKAAYATGGSYELFFVVENLGKNRVRLDIDPQILGGNNRIRFSPERKAVMVGGEAKETIKFDMNIPLDGASGEYEFVVNIYDSDTKTLLGRETHKIRVSSTKILKKRTAEKNTLDNGFGETTDGGSESGVGVEKNQDETVFTGGSGGEDEDVGLGWSGVEHLEPREEPNHLETGIETMEIGLKNLLKSESILESQIYTEENVLQTLQKYEPVATPSPESVIGENQTPQILTVTPKNINKKVFAGEKTGFELRIATTLGVDKYLTILAEGPISSWVIINKSLIPKLEVGHVHRVVGLIQTPKHLPPGRYEGRVLIRGEGFEERVNISLQVVESPEPRVDHVELNKMVVHPGERLQLVTKLSNRGPRYGGTLRVVVTNPRGETVFVDERKVVIDEKGEKATTSFIIEEKHGFGVYKAEITLSSGVDVNSRELLYFQVEAPPGGGNNRLGLLPQHITTIIPVFPLVVATLLLFSHLRRVGRRGVEEAKPKPS